MLGGDLAGRESATASVVVVENFTKVVAGVARDRSKPQVGEEPGPTEPLDVRLG